MLKYQFSTNVGDIEQMIPDAKHGFTAQIGDVESIKKGIQSAYNLNNQESQKLQEMAQIEKDYLSTNFSMQNQLHSIENIYQEVLHK